MFYKKIRYRLKHLKLYLKKRLLQYYIDKGTNVLTEWGGLLTPSARYYFVAEIKLHFERQPSPKYKRLCSTCLTSMLRLSVARLLSNS